MGNSQLNMFSQHKTKTVRLEKAMYVQNIPVILRSITDGMAKAGLAAAEGNREGMSFEKQTLILDNALFSSMKMLDAFAAAIDAAIEYEEGADEAEEEEEPCPFGCPPGQCRFETEEEENASSSSPFTRQVVYDAAAGSLLNAIFGGQR